MMARNLRFAVVLSFALLLTMTSLGCDTGFVNKAARSSAASFINDILNTAVRETLIED
ncbi:MAG: hypothetical protein GY842_27350 [bacterium]|nr:hypothetical protein [bacterium]